MNEEYLLQACEKCREIAKERGEVFDTRLFITGVSKRAAQLAKGYRRLISLKPGDHTPLLDIALQEVAAGKVIIERGDFRAVEQEENVGDEIPSVNEF